MYGADNLRFVCMVYGFGPVYFVAAVVVVHLLLCFNVKRTICPTRQELPWITQGEFCVWKPAKPKTHSHKTHKVRTYNTS